MWLVVAPILMIVMALLGVGIYGITGDRTLALWMCGTALGVSVVLGPIAWWRFLKGRTPSKKHTLTHD